MRGKTSGFGALLCAIAVGCSSAVESEVDVESITVTPSIATVAAGANLPLTVEMRDADGNVVPGVRVSWGTEDASIATVSQSGVVTGVRIGTVLIAASARGKDAFSRITVSPTPVASIRLSFTNRSMFIGESVSLNAEPLDAAGQVLPGRTITWSTSNASVATVTNGGLVTAVSSGGAIISASSEGRSAFASITVAPVPVASIDLSPDVSNVVVGQTTQLTADVRDASGAPLTGRVLVWSTDAAHVATVTSQGVVTAVGAGSATITASIDDKRASASINVTPRPVSAVILSPGQVTIFPGQTLQLSAIVTDDRGQVLSGKPVTYSSSNAQVASVSSAGLVTGISAGSVTITATSEGATGTASVTVAREPVAVVEVSPSTASIAVGQPVQLTAIARGAAGQVLSLTGRTVSWATGSPSIATISASGIATGVSPGTTTIIATVDGRQGSATVSVLAVPVASVVVNPPSTSVTVGQSTTLTATALDANGIPLAGRVVGWSSSDNVIASVSSNGTVTGVAVGNAVITATVDGQTGTATVAVGAVPVASVVVSPTQPTLTVGQTVQLSATARDAAGQPLPGRVATWSTSAASVATVSSSGLVTGVTAGSATITATIDGQTGSATVTVNAVAQGVVTSVTVSPSSATVNVAWSTTLSATARDGNGNPVQGAQITWSSSDPAVATVSNGVVTGVAPGSVTITATSGSATGTASITVQLAPVDRIVVAPSNPSVKPGQTVQLAATLYDQQDNVLTGRTVTWASSDATRASVDATGLVTAIKKGNVTITASSGGKSGTTTVKVQ